VLVEDKHEEAGLGSIIVIDEAALGTALPEVRA
jgi:hypothetical protein